VRTSTTLVERVARLLRDEGGRLAALVAGLFPQTWEELGSGPAARVSADAASMWVVVVMMCDQDYDLIMT
jgi:hypothetical protein